MVKMSSKARATVPGSYRELENQLRGAISDTFKSNTMNKSDISSYPVDILLDKPVTSGTVVIEDYNSNKYFKVPFSSDKDGNYTLGDPVEVQQSLTYESVKSSVLAVEKAKDHVMFTGTVLIPGEPDCDFDNGEEPLTEEKVAKMAHEFITNYRIVDKNHDYFNTGKEVGQPVESWLLDEPKVLKNIKGEEREYPKGTWIVKSKITDHDSMKKAAKGEVAYSVTALPKTVAEQLKASVKDRTLIKDLKDPVGFTVSLVENPCVDNSCSAKHAAANKAGRSISKQNKSILEKARDLITGLLDSEVETSTDGGNNVTKENDKENEYVTKSDLDAKLEDVKTEIVDSVKAASQPPAPAPKKCPKCGATVGAKDKFCAACGAELTGSSSSGKSKPEEEDPEETGGASKSLPNHDNGKEEPAFKSVEAYMGRTPKGRPIKKVKE